MLGELAAGEVGQFQEALVEANYSLTTDRFLQLLRDGQRPAALVRDALDAAAPFPHGALPYHGQPAGRVHGRELRPLRAGSASLASDGAVSATRPPDAFYGASHLVHAPRSRRLGSAAVRVPWSLRPRRQALWR